MLQNQHIVMSGGMGALGLPTIKAFVDHGAKVSVTDIIDPEEASDRISKGTDVSEFVFYQQCDVTHSDEVSAFMDSAYGRFSPINTCSTFGV